MSCFHPNIIQYKTNSIIKKNGTLGTKIHVIYSSAKDFKGYEHYLKAHKEIQERDKNLMEQQNQEWGYKLVPCGKCLGCKAKYRQDWALRIELECQNYAHNYFLTLTYDDKHINIPKSMKNPSTGEIHYNNGLWQGTLVKKDVQLFLKKLRNYFKYHYNHDGMKFYLCGEYGEIGQRPHYHMILMNCPKINFIVIGKNPKTKDMYYTNEQIEKIWGKGFINIGKVSWESTSYVTGYCSKKLFGTIKDEYYTKMGQIPIFANMSRRPGIGSKYFHENKNKIYKTDSIINSKGKSIKPPKYFDRLMDIGEHDVMIEIKKQREIIAQKKLDVKLTHEQICLEKILFNQEKIAEKKQKLYNRERIKPSTIPNLQINNVLPTPDKLNKLTIPPTNDRNKKKSSLKNYRKL